MPPRRKYFDMYDISSFKIKPEPVILGIESSCDETACAVIRGRKLLSSCIISSAAEQAKYGGVVPEIASRAHTEAVDEVVLKALGRAGERRAAKRCSSGCPLPRVSPMRSTFRS